MNTLFLLILWCACEVRWSQRICLECYLCLAIEVSKQGVIYVLLMGSRKDLQFQSAVLSDWPCHVIAHCYVCQSDSDLEQPFCFLTMKRLFIIMRFDIEYNISKEQWAGTIRGMDLQCLFHTLWHLSTSETWNLLLVWKKCKSFYCFWCILSITFENVFASIIFFMI